MLLDVGAGDLELQKTGCHFGPRNYFPRARSAHLIPYLGIESASEVAKIDKWNNSSLNEEPRSDSRQNNHAKSHQRPGKPGAPQTNLKKSKRLPRTPFETFSIR